ncbi:FlxA-like family protein [Pandoraea commovens]|uniref:FlxA-like family protein n=1 Tax=Pandoraea commovens TaxID=2508289 RepID=A0ABY5QJX8_9BURK|nr:FlxA-like family protein [Pandoraea commovens]UVA81106.1 FlxA-like family protein [Pandoraea commovens]
MTIIIPTKGNATSSMLEIWQSHIQQQQADKAQAAAKTAAATGTVNQAASTKSAGADDAAKPATANTDATTNTDAAENNGVSRLGDKTLVDLRSMNESAKQQGQALSATDGGSGDDIKAQTIRKLKEMLAKVMKQLDAVRTNDRLPPEDKLQQTNALSAQAMSIQAQILALMAPTKATGNNVNTTA